MNLGTLISVSGAIDFPRETKFHDMTPIEEPKSGPSQFKPERNNGSEPPSERFARLCRWIIVALLSLAAVA
jgi:hypothetical protein